jgi:U2 small nuclear ribonucleoprotein A'
VAASTPTSWTFAPMNSRYVQTDHVAPICQSRVALRLAAGRGAPFSSHLPATAAGAGEGLAPARGWDGTHCHELSRRPCTEVGPPSQRSLRRPRGSQALYSPGASRLHGEVFQCCISEHVVPNPTSLPKSPVDHHCDPQVNVDHPTLGGVATAPGPVRGVAPCASMKLTAEILNSAPVRFNPLDERELCLRGALVVLGCGRSFVHLEVAGLSIAVIENLATTLVRMCVVDCRHCLTGCAQDQFDCFDLSDNQIRRLEHFPRLRRLKSLLLPNNYVSRISPKLGEMLPGLETLVLTNNRVSSLSEIEALASCKSLTFLSLYRCDVARLPNYRRFVLHTLPALKVLDFAAVSRAERADAEAFFRSAQGKAFKIAVSRAREVSKRPREEEEGEEKEVESDAKRVALSEQGGDESSMSERERAALAVLVERASTASELARIEAAMKSGTLPLELVEEAERMMSEVTT